MTQLIEQNCHMLYSENLKKLFNYLGFTLCILYRSRRMSQIYSILITLK